MLGVKGNKHRYFRIQVFVSIVISMAVYLAAREGLLPSATHQSPIKTIGIHMFTWGGVLAAMVICYFQQGRLRLVPVIFYAAIIDIGLFGYLIAGVNYDEFGNAPKNQTQLFFLMANFVGFLILGGVTAWLGKAIGLLVLATIILGATSGSYELLALSPFLAFFNVTSVYGQWIVAIVITGSSFLADR